MRSPAQNDQYPNIIFLVLDTARAQNFFCYGHQRETTPHIDAFSDNYVKCENAISVAPWTLPSHASLFTGTPPAIHQTNSLDSAIPEALSTLPEVLTDMGYRTVGIASNPWLTSQFNVTNGFEDFHHLFGPLATESYREFVKTVTDTSLPRYKRIQCLLQKQSVSALVKNSLNASFRYLNEQEDDGAARALKIAKDVVDKFDRFFLFVNFLEPHLPYDPPEEYKRKFIPDQVKESRLESLNQDAIEYNIRNKEMSNDDFELLERLYDAELNYVDACIAELFQYMRDRGKFEDTLIFILGDHGENIGDHGLMGHQYSVHDTLVHIPLIFKPPITDAESRSIQHRVSSLDVPATVAEFLPGENQSLKRFINQQKGELISENSKRRSPVFAEYLNPMPPISRLETRLQNDSFDVSQYDCALRAVYLQNWKLIRGSDGETKLYNIVEDPYETANKSSEFPSKVTEMEQILDEISKQYDDDYTSRTSGPSEGIEKRLEDLGYL